MNFEDEDYARYYTRETASWLALGWEGQTVLALMLHGKFDRSGVFECDDMDPAEAVSLVTRVPIKVVRPGLARLLKGGTWVLNGGRLVWPNYVRAQNCRRSDRARQQESRESRRLEAMTDNREEKPDLSPPVTSGHTESQPVTPSLAKPSQTERLLGAPESAAPKTKARRWRKFPEDFVPDETHHEIARELRLDMAQQLALVRDHEFKDPKSDAAAVFRTWLRNAPKYSAGAHVSAKSSSAQPERSGPSHKLFVPEGIDARREWRKALYEAAMRGEHGSEWRSRMQAATSQGKQAISKALNVLEAVTPKPLDAQFGKVGTSE